MKKQIFTTISGFLLIFLFSANVSAFAPTNAAVVDKASINPDVNSSELTETGLVKKRSIKNVFIAKKNAVKRTIQNAKQKLANALDIDLKDDVEKWKWYWILGWGGAVLLYILGLIIALATTGVGFGFASILFLLSSLAGLLGTVGLIMWLIKSME